MRIIRNLPSYRSKAISIVSIFAVVLLGVVSNSKADDSYAISSVQIEGNKRIDLAAIRAQLKVAPGSVSTEQVNNDVKALYNTGFFDQVQAKVSDGGVLTYALVEKPVVRKVFIRGNDEVSENDLADILRFGAKRFLDRGRVDGLIKQAIIYYQTRGFYDVKFDYSVTPVGDNQVDLTFVVTEGPAFTIREISINGLKEVDESELLDVMQTKRYKWWSSWLLGTGRLSEAMLQNDKQLMRQYLLDHGFVDANISDPQIERADGYFKVVFQIEEGPEYKFGTISASGDLVDQSVAKTIDGIESETGETFSAATLREDSFKVTDKFADKGYAFANVVPNTLIDREKTAVNIDFAVTKGKPVTINRINIRGNDKTYDNVIRRELKVAEQSTYSSSKIKRSQELLQRLGYFEEVNISNEPSSLDDKVDLLVNVREASTGTFTAGAGYSTSDGALFNARISENNIFGMGRSVDLNVEAGTERDNITLSYNDRRLADSYVAWGSELFRTDRTFSDFDRRLQGGATSFGYPLEEVFGENFEDISAAIRYELLQIDIRDVDTESAAPLVLASEGKSVGSGFTPSITRNTINNPLNPVRGSLQSISFEMAGAGGDQEYTLLSGKNTMYIPLWSGAYGDLVFSNRTRVDYGESRNDDPFPLYKRFFAGGINSVRGFKSRSLGPKDANGNEFGGSKQLVNNAEIIFPIINSAGIRGLFFYDVGNSFDDNQTIDVGALREAAGTGIRWASPLGPLRIEFGWPLDKQEGEDNMVTMFSFGAPL